MSNFKSQQFVPSKGLNYPIPSSTPHEYGYPTYDMNTVHEEWGAFEQDEVLAPTPVPPPQIITAPIYPIPFPPVSTDTVKTLNKKFADEMLLLSQSNISVTDLVTTSQVLEFFRDVDQARLSTFLAIVAHHGLVGSAIGDLILEIQLDPIADAYAQYSASNRSIAILDYDRKLLSPLVSNADVDVYELDEESSISYNKLIIEKFFTLWGVKPDNVSTLLNPSTSLQKKLIMLNLNVVARLLTGSHMGYAPALSVPTKYFSALKVMRLFRGVSSVIFFEVVDTFVSRDFTTFSPHNPKWNSEFAPFFTVSRDAVNKSTYEMLTGMSFPALLRAIGETYEWDEKRVLTEMSQLDSRIQLMSTFSAKYGEILDKLIMGVSFEYMGMSYIPCSILKVRSESTIRTTELSLFGYSDLNKIALSKRIKDHRILVCDIWGGTFLSLSKEFDFIVRQTQIDVRRRSITTHSQAQSLLMGIAKFLAALAINIVSTPEIVDGTVSLHQLVYSGINSQVEMMDFIARADACAPNCKVLKRARQKFHFDERVGNQHFRALDLYNLLRQNVCQLNVVKVDEMSRSEKQTIQDAKYQPQQINLDDEWGFDDVQDDFAYTDNFRPGLFGTQSEIKEIFPSPDTPSAPGVPIIAHSPTPPPSPIGVDPDLMFKITEQLLNREE